MTSLGGKCAIIGGLVLIGGLSVQSASANIIEPGGAGILVQTGPGGYSTNVFENIASNGSITGYGYAYAFGPFNSPDTTSGPSYCASGSTCALTFQLGGLDVTSSTTTSSTSGNFTYYYTNNSYTTGFLTMYSTTSGATPTNTTYAFGTTPYDSNYTAAANGIDWLDLSIQGLTSTTTTTVNTSLGTTSSQTIFSGGLDVTSGPGVANYTFATKSLSGFFNDLTYQGSGPNTSAQNPTNSKYSWVGNAGGNYYAVPEPSDLGMMGLGLLMVGMLGLRMRQSRFRRD
ncbi:PEP-CTERM sorting domain-containing protein [Acidihalobacter aeolianus]|uniref:PEP-CTERM sorting domain-containing protein n=1 Tax=Acidihalobacter aeolianus TaxID=2792603 RepID=UPI0012EA8171|nr:PEP-CTERM sorting domain-containing protein [Acidihalobacter aeolianus]